MTLDVLTALAEPNRFRIVELLGVAPRSVGEIAGLLELRQPQVTKHLQALERADLVHGYRLGRRHIYSLSREPLRRLRGWLAGFDDDLPDERTLADYRRALDHEEARVAGGTMAEPREWTFARSLRAPAAAVWEHWTRPDLIATWWSPDHFTVGDCQADPTPDGLLRIVLVEDDGTSYVATGRYVSLDSPSALAFQLAPLDDRGRPLFSASYDVRLTERGRTTRLSLAIRVSGATAEAVPAVAGMALGWEQSLDKLAGCVESGTRRR